jgi:hypothetical protein
VIIAAAPAPAKPHAPSQYIVHSGFFFSHLDFGRESNLPQSLPRLEILLMFFFQIRCSAEITLLLIFPIFEMICNFAGLLLEDDLLVL